jgi:hypothetical protein
VTLLATEGQILGDHDAQSREFDKGWSVGPEARELSPEDFDPEPARTDSGLPMVDPSILLTACRHDVKVTVDITNSGDREGDEVDPALLAGLIDHEFSPEPIGREGRHR